MTASTPIAVRTADSTDRTPVLAARPVSSVRPAKMVTRVSGAARRLLGSIMRSLATPHV